MSYRPSFIYEDNQIQILRGLAHAVFFLGALASCLDGFLTWLVVRSAGVNLEQNWGMGWLMRHLGVGTTCTLRAIVGVAVFWYIANLLVGRRIFLTKWRYRAYIKWLKKDVTGRFGLWFRRNKASIMAFETIVVLGITCAVVGNNIETALVYFHHGL